MSTHKSKRHLLRFPLILFLIFVIVAASVPVQAADDAFSQLDANGQTVAMAINQMRAQAGLAPLAMNAQLNLAAQNHVNDVIANYNYSHTGSDGSNVRQRVQRTGYAASTWVSENWVSVSDPSMAIQWWMNSYVHRNNILNTNWHELGLGAGYQASNHQFIFVAVFSTGESNDSVFVAPPELEPLPIPAGGLQYQIQYGDTLLSIGLRYGVEWPLIAGANNLSEFSLLQIGQVIRVPGVENVGGFVGQDDNAGTVHAAAQAEPEPISGDTFVRRYTVQTGDTLAGIAAIYDLSWQALAGENGLGEYSVLSIGDELRIPGEIEKPTTTIESTLQAASHGSTPAAADSKPDDHVVVPGDTIISIAARYDMDWHDLLRLNNLSENSMIQLGQTIRLR